MAVTAEAVDAIANGERVGSALKKADAFHRAASFADKADVAANGRQFATTSAKGVPNTLVQTPATVNGAAGRFEWVIEADGTVSHQIFVRGGTINGVPIVP